MQLFLKMLCGMANIEDPDQQSDLVLQLAYAILSETLVYKSLGHLMYGSFLVAQLWIYTRIHVVMAMYL